MPTFPEQFQALRQRYFDRVRDRLSLSGERSSQASSLGFASVSAAGGYVRVYFESDRGLCSFLVGFVDDERDLCSVDTLAERFARLRILREGQQRLSLDEQASFLCDNWADLQIMFSPAHERETRAWRAAQSAAYTKKFTGDT